MEQGSSQLKLSDSPLTSKWPQYTATFAANIASVITGCIIGWTSPSLPYLESEDSPIPITKEENSWISSLSPLAAALGPFAAGFLAEKYGRKISILGSAVPALVSWICLAAGTDVPTIYVARVLSGIVVGWIFTVVPMYVGEIATKDVRGALGSYFLIFIVFGLLFAYCIGPYIPYVWLSVASAVWPALLILVFVWMPESPYYLLMKGDETKAAEALVRLRGSNTTDAILPELQIMQGDVETAKSQQGNWRDIFASKGNIKALIISLGLVGFQQLSGINVVLFNTQAVFEQAGGSLTADVSTIITGVVMLVASCATPLLVERLGRRVLLLTSAVGMGAAQAVLGYCFYLDKQHTDISSFAFLPVLSVVVYICAYSIGFGSLPWAVMGEMFLPNIRSLASTLTASFNWILAFLVTRFYNDLTIAVGHDFTFWIFAICCAIATVFVFILLPETKGKSLAEIQIILNK